MDPRTALIVATLMMLLNGGVLGLMQRGMSPDVQPSAADWRIGTLLAAGGSLLLAAQEGYSPGFILPMGNGCLFLAMALYWRAVRRFDGHADAWWIFLPVALASFGIFWFAAVMPSLEARVIVATVAWSVCLLPAASSLIKGSRHDAAASRRVLAAMMLSLAGFMLLRLIYFVARPSEATSILDTASWVNAVTPLMVAVLPVVGTTAFLMMCSERIRRQWELAATTDYLTDLPNRRTINATGQSRFAAARRTGHKIAVAIIDIDHFKSFNDHFGHECGDQALKHVAALLAQNCRGPSLVGRLGGEEFVALFENAGTNEALAAAERLRASIEQAPVILSGETRRITVSIGISLIANDDNAFDDVLRRADRALYVAKSSGRNRVESDVE
ncbi:MAG: GGDEF domain-containing protein [Betaproteobacteria bacterium]